MDHRDVFVEAVQASKAVVDQIRDDQWSMEMPSDDPEQKSTLRDAVNYIAYDMVWVPDMMAGRATSKSVSGNTNEVEGIRHRCSIVPQPCRDVLPSRPT
jgi:hypothetical protein